MRNLLLCLLFFPVFSMAQQREVIRIDSLPKEGILLDKGWKWHAGDNPEWAKPDFDDAKWENIDPTKDIFELPQLSRSGEIGWFRIKIKVNKSIQEQFLFILHQSGASEMYLDGKLIHRYGTLSHNLKAIKAISPIANITPINLPNDSTVVIAFRYCLQPHILYTRLLAQNNAAIQFVVYPTLPDLNKYYPISRISVQYSIIFRIGAFLILASIFLSLYFFYPRQKTNLFFFMYTIAVSTFDVGQFVAFSNNQIQLRYYLITIGLDAHQVGTFFLLTALYLLMNQKRGGYYWVLMTLIILGIIVNASLYQYAEIVTVVGISNLINIEIIRITFKSLKIRRNGALIITIGGISFALFWSVFILSLIFNFLNTSFLGTIFTIGDVVYNLAQLSIPIAVCIYFGLDIALTNKALGQKLIEVETLSDEKQTILAGQNETLERQVKERTAELVHKNRDLEIEAALERVRSRTMAMQKSDELAETSFLLDSQVRALGIKTRGCGFNIYGGNESTEWFSSELGTMPTYKTPREHFFLSFYEAGQRGETLLLQEFAGEECVAHYDYLCSLPITGEGFRQFKASGGSFPTRQIDHVAYFKYGYLLFITLESVPEAHDIFIRFAKVFEQTYTRFLDLQKAEEQAEQARLNLIQIQTEKKRAEDALVALKQTQAQLIQSEKLASLGELTAGIAHEIQNPLNFVNNFAEVSAELLDDMKADLQAGKTTEAVEIADDLQVNLQKINHHGQRASAIVKGMLEHSRTGDAMNRVSTDLNALADEYLRLAYHGLRAKDSSFNATMETHFDPDLPKIEVIPQDIGRVLLSLINNAFYAVHEKNRQLQTQSTDLPGFENLEGLGYQPTVIVRTKKLENAIQISVKDNGNGIPEAIKDKIFQPFFTTKPTGQGTGLGLSLAYDIVTKGHGGTLIVSSIPGAETTFEIQLPINGTNLGS